MKINKFLKSATVFTGPILIIALTVVLTFLILLPRFRLVQEMGSELKIRKDRLQKLSIKLSDLEGIDEFSLREKTDLALKILPDQKDILKPVSVLNALAFKEQVYLESLDVRPGEVSSQSATTAAKEVKVENLGFKIKTLGTWERTLDFLFGIEKTLPLLNINTFKINNSGRAAILQLEAETFRSPLPTTLGKVDAALAKLSTSEEESLSLIKDYQEFATPQISIELSTGEGSVSAGPRSSPFGL